MHTKQALERLSRERLIAALLFLLAVVRPTRKGVYRKAEKILGITGSRISKSKKGRKGRKNTRAAKAMRYMRVHKVSLKEAWKHV